jgi:hypothetical protein
MHALACCLHVYPRIYMQNFHTDVYAYHICVFINAHAYIYLSFHAHVSNSIAYVSINAHAHMYLF